MKESLQTIIVSSNSKFSDCIWEFLDDSEQLSHFPKGRLTIDWKEFSELPASLIEEIKIVAFLLLTTKKLSPLTVVCHIREFRIFVSLICEDTSLEINERSIVKRKVYTIEHLCDLDIGLIARGFVLYDRSYKRDIKRILKFIPNSYFIELVDSQFSKVGWSAIQLRSLKNATYKTKEPRNIVCVPDEAVSYLVANASYLVFLFLFLFTRKKEYRIELEACANTYQSYFEHINEFTALFNYYRQIYSGKFEESCDTVLRRRIKASSQRSVEDFQREILKIHSAALYLILQFTGMRYGEVAHLKYENLVDGPFGISLIKGNVKKKSKSKHITKKDTWVACPIVKTSFEVINIITTLSGQNRILSTAFISMKKRNSRPMANNTLTNRLRTFLWDIDVNRLFTYSETKLHERGNAIKPKFELSPHRLRHTVSNLLVRGGLNVVDLSRHFKHLSFSLHSLFSVPDVTIGYGNISYEILNSKLLLDKAIGEIELKIQNRNNIQGPGALTFKELMASNLDGCFRDTLVDVGLCYCMGRNRILSENGELEEPPCIKFGECQSWRCRNAFTTIDKLPRWEAFLKDINRRIDNPDFLHLRPSLMFARGTTIKVINKLKHDPS
jgi:integrase